MNPLHTLCYSTADPSLMHKTLLHDSKWPHLMTEHGLSAEGYRNGDSTFSSAPHDGAWAQCRGIQKWRQHIQFCSSAPHSGLTAPASCLHSASQSSSLSCDKLFREFHQRILLLQLVGRFLMKTSRRHDTGRNTTHETLSEEIPQYLLNVTSPIHVSPNSVA
jgi:hypothetical protein